MQQFVFYIVLFTYITLNSNKFKKVIKTLRVEKQGVLFVFHSYFMHEMMCTLKCPQKEKHSCLISTSALHSQF